MQMVSESRPGLSLLAYCCYHAGQFEQAASMCVRWRGCACADQTAHPPDPAARLSARCLLHGGCFCLLCRYDQLCRLCPDNEPYKLYFAQALYKVCVWGGGVVACGPCSMQHTAGSA